MKVLMINVVCGIRSTGRICTDIALGLKEQGHEVRIAYGRGNVPEKYKENSVQIGTIKDTVFHGIKARLIDGMGLGSKKATEEFIDWVEDYNPDIIHLHNLHGYYINIEILFNYIKKCKKRIIWTLHDCWSFTGHCVYFDYVNCDKWKMSCGNCPQWREYPSRVGLDMSTRNLLLKKELFTGITNMSLVVPSMWLSNLISESFLKEYPIRVIHNGIDTSVFKATESDIRKKYKCQEKKVVLGVAAVWDKRKGLETFYSLANLLDESYQIILVGLSKKQISKLPKKIIGIERTNSVEELVELYSAADVYVNPTLEDNYPTTNIEAIACGTPVITYETGGSIESARMYGICITKGKISELVDAIYRCKEIVPDKVDVSYLNSVQKYLELYEGR